MVSILNDKIRNGDNNSDSNNHTRANGTNYNSDTENLDHNIPFPRLILCFLSVLFPFVANRLQCEKRTRTGLIGTPEPTENKGSPGHRGVPGSIGVDSTSILNNFDKLRNLFPELPAAYKIVKGLPKINRKPHSSPNTRNPNSTEKSEPEYPTRVINQDVRRNFIPMYIYIYVYAYFFEHAMPLKKL
jgi:hypothetical protein